VRVAEWRLFESDAVQSGRAGRNLYEALQEKIDAARELYSKSFFETCKSMVDYLHVELVRSLCDENVEVLGGKYPGPLV